jgi:hypothetical protein
VLLVDILAIYGGKKTTLTLHKRDKRQAISDGRKNSLMKILLLFTLS